MNYKVIKIDEDNYRWLLKESANLQANYGKKVSMNDTISELRKKSKPKLDEFWDMSDEETKEFLKTVKSSYKWKNE